MTARAMFEEGQALEEAAASLYNDGLQLEGIHQVDAAEQQFQASKVKYEAATIKYEESVRLDPTPYALFNLADCQEWLGKPATAYALYKQAEDLATEYGYAALARDAGNSAHKIANKRSFLTIHVANPTPGLRVFRGHEEVGAPQFDTALPVDPGEYNVTALADGYAPFEQRVTIGDAPQTQRVEIPPLQPAQTPPVSPVPPPATPPRNVAMQAPTTNTKATPMQLESRDSHQEMDRTNPWPWVLGGLGVSAVVLGGVSGALALHDDATLSDACPDPKHCSNADALSIQPRRDFEWNVARIAVPVGIVSIGASAAWLAWGTQRKGEARPQSSQKSVSATLDRNGGALWIGGRF